MSLPKTCCTPGCSYPSTTDSARCESCILIGAGIGDLPHLDSRLPMRMMQGQGVGPTKAQSQTMAQKYPKYYKPIPAGVTELDVYAVCQMFPIQDDTGCIRHATKKLLVPGTRTGGKSFYDDIKEARDTLNRWLELNSAPKK